MVEISVVIPTYQRGRILLDTVTQLLRDMAGKVEIIVVDQTAKHEPDIHEALTLLDKEGRIRWRRLDKPSIPHAMNTGMLSSRCDIVLFLDDDIMPAPGLIEAHISNYGDVTVWGVAGQVLQPGQQPGDDAEAAALDTAAPADSFPFNSTRKQSVTGCMAGNFSVRREKALMIGGFDENFIGDAYRFETEFCRRLIRNGGKVIFEPGASLRHLQIKTGGTRTYGSHMTSPRPDLTSGEYYFVLREYSGRVRLRYIFHRLVRSVGRKFYLFHPWWLPVKLYAEICGLLLAVKLKRRGPAYIPKTETETA